MKCCQCKTPIFGKRSSKEITVGMCGGCGYLNVFLVKGEDTNAIMGFDGSWPIRGLIVQSHLPADDASERSIA